MFSRKNQLQTSQKLLQTTRFKMRVMKKQKNIVVKLKFSGVTSAWTGLEGQENLRMLSG